MNDYTGAEIRIGNYVRHSHEPLPPKEVGRRGLGGHTHNFFGVKKVSEVCSSVIVTTDGYVVLGCLVEVLPSETPPAEYIVPYQKTLLALVA